MEHDPNRPEGLATPEAAGQDALAPKKMIARRRLLRAGASATPVLLALRSGPVSATSSCIVASSFVSAATFASRNPGATYIQCSSTSAGDWCNYANSNCGADPATWPAWAKDTVKNHLGCSVGNATYDNATIGSILKMGLQSSGRYCILQHILGLTLTMQYASGYINVSSNSGGAFTKSYLGTVWQKYYPTQMYQDAAAGVNWDETKLLTWLKKLQYAIPAST